MNFSQSVAQSQVALSYIEPQVLEPAQAITQVTVLLTLIIVVVGGYVLAHIVGGIYDLLFDTLHISGVEANRKRAAINDARKKAEEAQAYLDSIPELDMSVTLDGVKV